MPSTPSTASRLSTTSLWRSRTRRDQLLACVIGAALLGGSMLMLPQLEARRSPGLIRKTPESEKTLRSLAVTFPRLTMGGFRGILSTALWMQAEEDKTDRKWLDLETKYDMIGALQPYFSSVYIFHAWNQAYNLSAQWQEQDTKYKWVLDGLAYLYKGEDYNPGVADIYLEIGHLYFLKLGGAAERTFYREHWRDDLARLHELNQTNNKQDDRTLALRHVREFINHKDARDTSNYFHLEEMQHPDPAQRSTATGWGVQIVDKDLFSRRTDGKAAGAPMEFRYGLSPFYFGYAEYKRCLSVPGGPSATSLRVIDAWPAMSLRLWCRDDLFYIGDVMRRMFGRAPEPELLGAKFTDKSAELHDSFRNIQMIGPQAIVLFNDHLGRFPQNEAIHTKHKMETEAYLAISKAEIKLFESLVQWQLNGRKLENPGSTIKQGFIEADRLYGEAYTVSMKWVNYMYPVIPGQPADSDRNESEQYPNNIKSRIAGIEAMLALPQGEKPDMGFLDDVVVEK